MVIPSKAIADSDLVGMALLSFNTPTFLRLTALPDLRKLAINFATELNDILERPNPTVVVTAKCPCYIQTRDPIIPRKIATR